MKYDNDRERTKYGHDAGQIVDGVVTWDSEKSRYIIVDEDGIGYDIQEEMKRLKGQKIRQTIVSFSSMEDILEMMRRVNPSGN